MRLHRDSRAAPTRRKDRKGERERARGKSSDDDTESNNQEPVISPILTAEAIAAKLGRAARIESMRLLEPPRGVRHARRARLL
ncbi:Hypothetical protein NTJ_05758 [Nesidiocoris tenuis]|uniref:Uncharacterized protein n=1 Tax=Nesidiocoris tenuis TaxID=355587 RepID=A0ABN7ALY2_9HEMI|nr:Hypothetical protein NTJ_05758 [Nesidiocoris tenuis]